MAELTINQRKSMVLAAISDMVNTPMTDSKSVYHKIEAAGYLKGLLAAFELQLTTDKPNLKIVCYMSGREFCRWERSI